MKDWVGNGNSVFKTLGASNHAKVMREQDDFYATSPKAIDALLEYEDICLPHEIWEPSCGTGCLSKRLIEHGFTVLSSDLVDRGFGKGGVNFFEEDHMPENVNCILTNPPYKFATQYVTHALSLLHEGGVLCLFLKTTFAEGQDRYRKIFAITPPRVILQCTERILCAPNADFSKTQSSAVSYAWWVWEKGWKGKTTFDWINHKKVQNIVQLKLY